jgi:hypothetical protein
MQEGTIVAKNKNQNRQQHEERRDSGDQHANPAAEPQEQSGKSGMAEEHIMPAATHSARKQQKRFGHN